MVLSSSLGDEIVFVRWLIFILIGGRGNVKWLMGNIQGPGPAVEEAVEVRSTDRSVALF